MIFKKDSLEIPVEEKVYNGDELKMKLANLLIENKNYYRKVLSNNGVAINDTDDALGDVMVYFLNRDYSYTEDGLKKAVTKKLIFQSIDYHRKLSTRIKTVPELNDYSQSEELSLVDKLNSEEKLKMVFDFMKNEDDITEKQIKVMQLMTMGKTHSEIVSETGIKLGTVKNNIARTKEKIKKEFGDDFLVL